jgi:pilus assembly protein CpaB
MLTETEIMEKYIQPGALRKKKDAVGKIAKAPMAEGEQILANKITFNADSLSSLISIGKRAVSISVDSASGVNELIRPGDCVDVLGTFDEGRGSSFASTVLQNVKVAAVEGRFNNSYKKSDNIKGTFGPFTATLELDPSEAEIIAFAENKGKLKLALRNPGDTLKAQSKTVNFGNLMQNVSREAAKPVPEIKSLQIIRGTEDEKVQIKK